jgi:uncharacterized protein (DUF1330 family)
MMELDAVLAALLPVAAPGPKGEKAHTAEKSAVVLPDAFEASPPGNAPDLASDTIEDAEDEAHKEFQNVNSDLDRIAAGPSDALDPAARERIARAYTLPTASPEAAAWDGLIARAETDDAPITVIEIDRLHGGARPQHDEYLAAVRAATEQAGGAVYAVSDILEPGVGDLLPYMDYAGGVAVLLSFPSRRAYLMALLSDAWQAGLAARERAVADAIVLVAGENSIPAMARAMFGEPRSASEFSTPNIEDKTPAEIVAELLTIYPDGGADPSRAQLEVMMNFPGFREQPVHYINLYAFGDGSDPAVKGEAAHDAYNQAAMATVRAHGGYPLLRAEVEHRLVSAIPWSRVLFVRWPSLAVFTDMRLDPEYVEAQKHRVESAETYGNFVTIAREGEGA